MFVQNNKDLKPSQSSVLKSAPIGLKSVEQLDEIDDAYNARRMRWEDDDADIDGTTDNDDNLLRKRQTKQPICFEEKQRLLCWKQCDAPQNHTSNVTIDPSIQKSSYK